MLLELVGAQSGTVQFIALLFFVFSTGLSVGVYVGWWALMGHNIHITPKEPDYFGAHNPNPSEPK